MKHVATVAAATLTAAAIAALAFLAHYAATLNEAYTTVLQIFERAL